MQNRVMCLCEHLAQSIDAGGASRVRDVTQDVVGHGQRGRHIRERGFGIERRQVIVRDVIGVSDDDEGAEIALHAPLR